ncbi:hypothetical protein WA158_003678 [Blastocystis sp. Blastoise]
MISVFFCYAVMFYRLWPKKGQTLIERIVEVIYTMTTKFFFKDITINGKEKIPKTGPVILVCAPHANQFVDAMILSSQMPRKVYFIGAASSFKIPVVGSFMKLMNSIIPVNRPEDLAIPVGEVVVNEKEVIGTNTHFTEFTATKACLLLGKHKVAIDKIIDDTHILLTQTIPVGMDEPKKSPFTPLELTTEKKVKTEEELKEEQGIYKCKYIPHLDNHKMFSDTYSKLLDNNCVAIFPEGGSHDRPDLLPLKVGVSLLTLGFHSLYPDQELTVIPVGMNYYHGHIFRKATLLMDIGDPIPFTQYTEAYNLGGEEKKEVVGEFLNDVRRSLNTVTTTACDWEENTIVETARRIYTQTKVKLSTEQKVKIQRHFLEGLKEYGEEEDVKEVVNEIDIYRDYLDITGFSDKQVVEQGCNPTKQLYKRNLFISFIMSIITGIICLPGTILALPMYIIVPIYTSKKQQKALAKSYVKIEAKDILATNKIICSLLLFIVLLFFYPFLYAVYLYTYKHIRMTYIEYFSLVCMLPWIFYAGVLVGEYYVVYYKKLSVYMWRATNIQRGKKIYDRRQKIQNLLSVIIEKYGPLLYSNFEDKRILTKDGMTKLNRVNTIMNFETIFNDQIL